MANLQVRDAQNDVIDVKASGAGSTGDPNVPHHNVDTIAAGASPDIGATTDAEATGNGSSIAILKRLRTLLGSSATETTLGTGITAILASLAGLATNAMVQAVRDRLPAAFGAGGGVKVDGSGTALPVSGTVTATGPLTDAQLRAAVVPVSLPAGGAMTDRSGTIAAGGTAQQVAASNAARRYLLIQNLSNGVLWVNTTGPAAVGQPSIALKAGAAANDGTGGAIVFEGNFIPTGAVSILGATTGQAFAAREA